MPASTKVPQNPGRVNTKMTPRPVQVAIYLPRKLDVAAEVRAAQLQITKSQLFAAALAAYLRHDGKGKP